VYGYYCESNGELHKIAGIRHRLKAALVQSTIAKVVCKVLRNQKTLCEKDLLKVSSEVLMLERSSSALASAEQPKRIFILF
jgi:hypothetical protein